MIKEEKILFQAMGKENHFKVPSGYFDQLTDQVMAKLPEREARIISMSERRQDLWGHRWQLQGPSWWQKMPLRKIAASVAVACMLGGGILAVLHQQAAHSGSIVARTAPHSHANSAAVKQASSEDATFNEMANYTMMDNETIYASLVAEN